MGWFDESDDAGSDDDRQDKKASIPAINTGEEDEEDPLDAYMKSLEETKNDVNKSTAPRLDQLNEEEATEHWKEYAENNYSNSDQKHYGSDQDEDNVVYADSYQASQARQALAATFHKAGARKEENGCDDHGLAGSTFSKTNCDFIETFSQCHEPFEKVFWNGTDTNEGRKWQHDNAVKVANFQQHHHNEKSLRSMKNLDPIYEFHELRDVFGNDLLLEISKHYSKPTLVQSQTLPVALAGKDAVVTAATGQGKTLAYIWPLAVHLSHQPPLRQDLSETGPIALVLVPTRELAIQVEQQARKVLAKSMAKEVSHDSGKLSSRAVIGGQGKYLLRQELKKSGGVDLVVATPGRLLDVLSDKKGLSLQRVTFIVLDEADKMLQMGFEAEVRKILSNVRKDRQTLMFSATMGNRVEKVASEWLCTDALRISVGRTGEASHNVNQHVIVLPNYDAKEAFVVEMLPTLVQLGRALVFVATRESCETLATSFRSKIPPSSGVSILTLHGDKHQSDRNAAVRAFTKGEVNVLIATDVAGRGLDIPNVQTVLSFDAAKNLDTHVHRVGRAGRLSKDNAGQQVGSAYTLLTAKDADFAHVLRNAFDREGRVITSDLEILAQKSRQSGNVESRNKWNKSGLGNAKADAVDMNSFAIGQTNIHERPTVRTSNVHDVGEPHAKRTRWG